MRIDTEDIPTEQKLRLLKGATDTTIVEIAEALDLYQPAVCCLLNNPDAVQRIEKYLEEKYQEQN